MRLKVAPEPRSPAFVREVSAALPIVPGSEDDCCARVVEATDVGSREAAREWITFCRALDLAEETDSGYRRLRRDPNREELATAFREGVFGADTLLDGLPDDEPLDETEAFEGFRSHIPNWERHRRPDWEDHWRERVRRLLGWAVAFDLAERVDDGYRVV